jgi:dienelactone hydrolase
MVIRSSLILAVASLVLASCGPGTAGPSSGPTPPAVPGSSGSPDASASPSPGPGSSQAASPAAAVGLAFVNALAGGDMAGAEAMEDATMRGAAPAAALTQLWSQLEGQFGAFTGLGEVAVKDAAPFVNATVTTYFANATVPLLVTVDAEGHVAGLHLGEPGPAASPPGGPGDSGATPAAPSPAPAESAAAYVRPDAFTETEVTVGSAPWALPGTLSMPTGSGPFPALVLVAGSGPQDRDETIGPNAPLRDLAWGLASNGIAVLRYDKRTKAHGAEMAAQVETVTVREEVTDDAIAAIDLLRTTPGVDPERVFLAGHSLGGYLAPRIAADASGRLAGIALLEANARPLQRLVEDQLAYLASDAGGADPSAQAMLAALPAQVALVESADLSPATPASRLPLGIPAAYWLDLRAYDPVATARALSIPLFITQGGRDYQVPPAELAAWRSGLGDRAGVTVREYPSLNHLLMAGTGPSRPAEYAQPGHVTPELVADLAAWVNGTP